MTLNNFISIELIVCLRVVGQRTSNHCNLKTGICFQILELKENQLVGKQRCRITIKISTIRIYLAQTVKSLQYRGVYSPSLSSLRHRVAYSGVDHIHHPTPFLSLSSSSPTLPPSFAHRQLKCLFCLVALSYGALMQKISRLKFGVVGQRMLVFEECQTRGFIMYHPLNSISFINTLFHRD